jgi:hypothetical protein
MGMNLPLGTIYKEDIILLGANVLSTVKSIDLTREGYAQYLLKEKFTACRIGIPYVVEGEIYDASSWITAFVHELPANASWFYYMDMSLRRDLSKWSWPFPDGGDQRILYIKCATEINWNDFLSSIWDLVKNNLSVVLLDTNKVLSHPKSDKILKSLVLRGVTLGFHGEFPKKWWQSNNRLVKKLAQQKIVDFWQTNFYDLNDWHYQVECHNKQHYSKFI